MPRIYLAAAVFSAVALLVPAVASAQPASGAPTANPTLQMMRLRIAELDREILAKTAAIKTRNDQIAALAERLNLLGCYPIANRAQIAVLQRQIDALNGQNQLDMVDLQRLSNQRTQLVELLTSVARKQSDTHQAIVANLRP